MPWEVSEGGELIYDALVLLNRLRRQVRRFQLAKFHFQAFLFARCIGAAFLAVALLQFIDLIGRCCLVAEARLQIASVFFPFQRLVDLFGQFGRERQLIKSRFADRDVSAVQLLRQNINRALGSRSLIGLFHHRPMQLERIGRRIGNSPAA